MLVFSIGVSGVCHEYLMYLKAKSDRVIAEGNPPPVYWTGDLAIIIRTTGRLLFLISISLALVNLKRWGFDWPNE